ncbi:Secreted RxLR effector peptide protein [Phytophthora palmivora]|uniref:Secreted RxLR effector peptide protein n=1 Tax=Phytophthora palmivora TaxID=4796 RepID=A0A2P4WY29_9STRA|nr:Secreted RxLR effector peptide protein [Phytophthora palmivora]
MRFNVFLTLLVVTFFACCSSFSSAETVANDAEVRRLRADAAPVTPIENSAKNAATFISKLKESATITKAVKQVMASDGDEQVIRSAMKLAAGAKEGAKISDDAIAKLSESMAVAVKKSPKSWPRLRKFVKFTLGAGVGALAIYGAYKLLHQNNSPVTTTVGSASA